MPRPSNHVEPEGVAATARHYIRDLVYGANLTADGLSMAVGNFLSIRAHESALEAEDLPEEEAHPWKHALATFVAFAVAGSIPLAPYILGAGPRDFAWSAVLTLSALFGVGAARTAVTVDRWWRAGLEMLSLGLVVAGVAYGAGALIAGIVTQ